MNLTQSIKTCFKKYATFSGRASRDEYWYWVICVIVASIVINTINDIIFPENKILLLIFIWVMLLPNLAINIRRLHDLNLSGWWLLPNFFVFVHPLNHIVSIIVALLLGIYGIVLLVFFFKKGTIGDNRYGKDPLQENLTK